METRSIAPPLPSPHIKGSDDVFDDPRSTEIIYTIDPYKLLRDWWGEELSSDLIEKITKRNSSTIRDFSRSMTPVSLIETGAVEPSELPEVDAGTLRPALVKSERVSFSGIYANTAASLLLYCHRLVLVNAVNLSWSQGADLAAKLGTLLDLKPLAEDGSISFVFNYGLFTNSFLHAELFGYTKISEESLASAHATYDNMFALYRRNSSDADEEELIDRVLIQIGEAQRSVSSGLYLAHLWPGQVQSIALDKMEEAALEMALSKVPVSGADSRVSSVQRLAAMPVLDVKTDLRNLVALRNSGSHFAEWRTHLSTALNAVKELPYTEGDGWSDSARAVINSELLPARERLQKESLKSSVISSMQLGAKNFALSGIGILAGTTVGGDVLPATVGGAAGTTASLLVSYIKALRQQKRNNAVLDVILKFSNSTEK